MNDKPDNDEHDVNDLVDRSKKSSKRKPKEANEDNAYYNPPPQVIVIDISEDKLEAISDELVAEFKHFEGVEITGSAIGLRQIRIYVSNETAKKVLTEELKKRDEYDSRNGHLLYKGARIVIVVAGRTDYL